MPLDETADAEIEESANFRIPPEHRYGISDIEE